MKRTCKLSLCYEYLTLYLAFQKMHSLPLNIGDLSKRAYKSIFVSSSLIFYEVGRVICQALLRPHQPYAFHLLVVLDVL